ncbi:MAG: hypothetical protein ABIU06_00595 [Anaerolineales bacterium]
MKITIFRCFSIAIVIVLTLAFVHPTLAHGDEPRLEISSDRMNPGGIVDVRGVSFGMEEAVTLTLISSSAEVPLGEILSDAEGEFLHIAVLPVELAEGTYYFRGVTSHHFVLSPPLTVWGVAIVEGGGQGERDEDDGLLAPMPTLAPGAAATLQPSLQTEPTPASVSNRNIPAPIVLAVLGIVIVALLFALKRKYS